MLSWQPREIWRGLVIRFGLACLVHGRQLAEIEYSLIGKMGGNDILQGIEDGFRAAWKFAFPLFQHFPNVFPLQIGCAAAKAAGDDWKSHAPGETGN